MENHVSAALRVTFVLHFIVAFVLGLLFLLAPELFGRLADWPIVEPAAYRLLGAALLGFGASSFLALREKELDKVLIVVRTEMVWTILGTIVLLWGMLYAGLPAFGWVNTAILGAFAVAFSVLNFKK